MPMSVVVDPSHSLIDGVRVSNVQPPIFLFDDDGYLYTLDSMTALLGWLEDIAYNVCFDSTARKIYLQVDPKGEVRFLGISKTASEKEFRERVGVHFSTHLKNMTPPNDSNLDEFAKKVASIVNSRS